jgi:hypothetical protein
LIRKVIDARFEVFMAVKIQVEAETLIRMVLITKYRNWTTKTQLRLKYANWIADNRGT